MGAGRGFPCPAAGLNPAWLKAPEGSRNQKALGGQWVAQNTFSAGEKPVLVFAAAG